MNTQLLNRALGSARPQELGTTQQSRLLYALQPTNTHFKRLRTTLDESAAEVAHNGGVNSIVIDKFEGRYLLSGGADANVSIWDLEEPSSQTVVGDQVYKPMGSIAKSVETHNFGVTHVSFYPFDSLAFLSSSYDHTVKLWSSETLQLSASFTLNAVVYSHALSPIAQHLIVACAIQGPTIRLLDLRSGASTHSLAGHSGAVLTVGWSPVKEYILASGGTDGCVRLWDVRKSSASLGVLDMEDSVGATGVIGQGQSKRGRQHGKAHNGPVNGIVWTEDGKHLVTAGHDEKVRVWDTDRCANMLVNFGPTLKNSTIATLLPLVSPKHLTPPEKDLLFFPSEKETLVYELFEGRLLKRLKTPSLSQQNRAKDAGRNLKNRTLSLAWRAHDVELYSAHGDGTIRAWKPRTSEEAMIEEDEDEEGRMVDEDRKRKREELEELYNDITKRRT